ncbi:cell division protein FtsN [Vibrio sp. 10N.286.49.B3]|uniref:SPOR domain-containing protein n=1 Tax=Vibrio sp. 10N.286.49.B3 TaxID=1880855 RepID=UPI000C849907|nr:SPOR domain-containing protein [Vibrio sp. 10N.286.49.B3]PMH46261.1 cell division protein FtsN [Vibrio sp. 10N.286.49.B3]
MANKDYVRRGRTTKKTTKKKKNAVRRKPWRSGLVAILLVSLFVWLLSSLSSDPQPEPIVPVVQEKPKPKPKPSKPIPPPPEEKWDYVESLPNRQVEVKAKEQVVSEIPYIMQCGAYKALHQAEARKLDVAFQGINSQIRKTENSSWYRVVLGPYKFKRDAERDRHKLQRAKIEPCAIWKDN